MAAIRGASLERLFRGAFLTRRSANHLGLLNVSIAQPARTLVAYRAGAISRASWEQPRSRVSPLLTSALQSYRSNSTISASTASSGISAESIAHEHEEHEAKTDPSVSRKIVGWWYLISGSLVFGIVVLGGLTRLTESGLSITEWNVIKGMKPPTSEADWNEEFDKYKSSPEYKLLNHNITLSEFKFIFYMEWAHRMWGRFIGLSFVLPGLYFARKGYMSRPIQFRSVVVGLMIGCQGLLGWLMVKSGLDHELMNTPNAMPRVSHYWLSAHLGSAFLIYSTMLLTGLEILQANKPLSFKRKLIDQLSHVKLARFKTFSKATALLVFVTAMTGALVAGLDAGLIYNEFPFMGLGLVPSDMWALSTPSERNPNPIPWWRNLLENSSAVQFNHRVMALSTSTVIVGLWAYSRRIPLPARSRLAMNALLGVTALQVSLGISTLLYFVPTPLAAAHQAGSLTLLSMALWLVHTLRIIK